MSAIADSAPGFHGKLLAKGDFVTRRLPRSFLDPWDAWLQDVIGGTRQRMGEAWLDAYLTSPIWRFGLSAELCGAAAAAGVVMPSVDRVGRYFPLSLVAILPDGADPLELPVSAAGWFRDAESLVRSALDDAFDFDRFDQQVASLGPPLSAAPPENGSPPVVSAAGLRLSLPTADAVGEAYRRIALEFLATNFPRSSLWWTTGSADVAPTLLVCAGLPTPEAFGAFLDGRWDHWGWTGAETGPRVLAQAQA